MSDCIRLVQNEKGEFEIYDDTYDITIHCRSEEEQKKAEKLLDAANRDMYWRKTTEEPPKKEDADEFWNVFGWYAAAKHAGPVRWDLVALYAIDVPYWMPLPEPPKGCEPHE